MDIREKMRSGELYRSDDDSLVSEQVRLMELQYDYNHTRPTELERRAALMKEIFAEVGEDCWLEPPFHANWGSHTHLGQKVYANFNLTLVDDTDVFIGDNTMIGPNVTIATAQHPISPALRELAYQYNLPVRIGRNVWLGSGAVILPGVTIGDNSVIGAGSVVTKDIPANVVAVGVPCKVLRPIGPQDEEFYYKERRIELK